MSFSGVLLKLDRKGLTSLTRIKIIYIDSKGSDVLESYIHTHTLTYTHYSKKIANKEIGRYLNCRSAAHRHDEHGARAG